MLAMDVRGLLELGAAEQSVGLKAGHNTPTRCPSTCRITNASEKVAGEISTSIEIFLPPTSFPKMVAQ